MLVTARKPELLEKTSEVFLKLARQDAQQKGKPDPAKTSSHRGLSITALGGDQGIAYCIAEGRLLASNSVKNVERLIDRGIELAAREGKPAAPGKADGALAALDRSPRWKAIRDKQGPDALAWSFVDLERLRKIDPKRFAYANQPDTGVTIFFGSWYEAFRKATERDGLDSLVRYRARRGRRLAAAKGRPSAGFQGVRAGRRERAQGRSSGRRARSGRSASGATGRRSGIRRPTCSRPRPCRDSPSSTRSPDSSSAFVNSARTFWAPSRRTGGWWSPRKTTKRSSRFRTSSIRASPW